MQNSVSKAEKPQGTKPPTDPPKFSKRIGSTTYIVSVHFSPTSKETVEDKLMRLIESEGRRSA